jgi:hypothetical protein
MRFGHDSFTNVEKNEGRAKRKSLSWLAALCCTTAAGK